MRDRNATCGATGATIGALLLSVWGAGQAAAQTTIAGVRLEGATLNEAVGQELTLRPAVSRSGLEQWLKFDELTGTTYRDASGNARSGTGTGTTAGVEGRVLRGVTLDGTESIACGTFDPVSGGDLTIACWVQWTAAMGSGEIDVIAAKHGGSSTYPVQLLVNNHASNGVLLALQGGSAGYEDVTWLGVGSPPTAGRWYHLAAVIDSGTVRFYVDGRQVGADDTGWTFGADTAAEIHWGNQQTGGSAAPFAGSLDDAMLYSRALSATEIAELAGAGTVRSAAGIRSVIGLEKRTLAFELTDRAAPAVTGDGAAYWTVPATLAGGTITDVYVVVATAGTTGSSTWQVARTRNGSTVDVLSTVAAVETTETKSDDAATQPVVNGSNDDLQTYDVLRIDCDSVSTTAPLGPTVFVEVTL